MRGSAFFLVAALRSFRAGNVTAPALEPSAVNVTENNISLVSNATAEPTAVAAQENVTAESVAENTTVETLAPVANATDDNTTSQGSGFSADAAAPVPVLEAAADVAPKVARPAPVEEPSAADVYARVNLMLNRRNREVRERVRAELAVPEPKAPQVEPAVEEKAPVPAEQEAPAPVAANVSEPEAAAPAANLTEAKPVEANLTEAKPVEASATELAEPAKPEPKMAPEVVPAPEVSPAVKAEEEAELAAPKKVEAKPAPPPVMTPEEQREHDFPTDWIKNDVKFNVDKDTMKTREDSVEAAVAAQQSWNSHHGQSWVQGGALRGPRGR